MPRKIKPIDHGSTKGYVMHYRREGAPVTCTACLKAWDDYYRDWKERHAG